MYLGACPKLLESDHNPERKHPGPSASLGIFGAHLAHMDMIRSKMQWQLPLSFETSYIAAKWLEGSGIKTSSCMLSNSCFMQHTKRFRKEMGPQSKRSWSIAIASFAYSVSSTKCGIISTPQRGLYGNSEERPFLLALAQGLMVTAFSGRVKFEVP